ncbi:MAG: 2TM domain-containing protein [Chloroflexota bacterium]|nr:2TM domain-containing protein [Chloroflexota bacterium]
MSQSANTQETRTRAEAADIAYRELRQRFVEGSLTLPELEEQLERVYRSVDLTGRRLPVSPSSSEALVPATYARAPRLRPEVVAYTLVMVMLLGIWAMSGLGYFWPIWPMMGWGLGIAGKGLHLHPGCDSHSTGRHDHR